MKKEKAIKFKHMEGFSPLVKIDEILYLDTGLDFEPDIDSDSLTTVDFIDIHMKNGRTVCIKAKDRKHLADLLLSIESLMELNVTEI